MLRYCQKSIKDPHIASGYNFTSTEELDTNDWVKFRHLSGSTWTLRFISLVIGVSKDEEVFACVDCVHGVHEDW